MQDETVVNGSESEAQTLAGRLLSFMTRLAAGELHDGDVGRFNVDIITAYWVAKHNRLHCADSLRRSLGIWGHIHRRTEEMITYEPKDFDTLYDAFDSFFKAVKHHDSANVGQAEVCAEMFGVSEAV